MSGTQSRPRGVTSRSKMYERYDIEIKTSSSGNGDQRWFNEEQDVSATPSPFQETLAILQTLSWKVRLLSLAALLWTAATVIRLVHGVVRGLGGDSSITLKSTTNKPERPFMDPDSHKRNNPFAPAGHVSVMEGVLEVKRIGGGRPKKQEQQQQQQQQADAENSMNMTASIIKGINSTGGAIENHPNPSQVP
ncbi:hypothetical protein HJC23_003841 [Cyclotella cryptica]|uniref:Uncharacterized protein n=1 Tax=Cyclotella cryptica TaxID=29204 RepID=A0ABD3Q049_9STRA